jgi:hypothetical protein
MLTDFPPATARGFQVHVLVENILKVVSLGQQIDEQFSGIEIC